MIKLVYSASQPKLLEYECTWNSAWDCSYIELQAVHEGTGQIFTLARIMRQQGYNLPQQIQLTDLIPGSAYALKLYKVAQGAKEELLPSERQGERLLYIPYDASVVWYAERKRQGWILLHLSVTGTLPHGSLSIYYDGGGLRELPREMRSGDTYRYWFWAPERTDIHLRGEVPMTGSIMPASSAQEFAKLRTGG